MSVRIATKRARESTFERAKVGAVISKGHRILASGCNEIRGYKTRSPKKWEDSVHAEQRVILDLLRSGRQHELVGATLYVSRITKDGNLALAKPCSICQELIESVGIKQVFYTTKKGTERYDL